MVLMVNGVAIEECKDKDVPANNEKLSISNCTRMRSVEEKSENWLVNTTTDK